MSDRKINTTYSLGESNSDYGSYDPFQHYVARTEYKVYPFIRRERVKIGDKSIWPSMLSLKKALTDSLPRTYIPEFNDSVLNLPVACKLFNVEYTQLNQHTIMITDPFDKYVASKNIGMRQVSWKVNCSVMSFLNAIRPIDFINTLIDMKIIEFGGEYLPVN
jgi:hypothetical protein